MPSPRSVRFLSINSGSAYRGSNPWGAANSFQALPHNIVRKTVNRKYIRELLQMGTPASPRARGAPFLGAGGGWWGLGTGWQGSVWRSSIGQQTQTSVFDRHFQNPQFFQGGTMSRKFSIAVFLLAFVAGLMVVGRTSHARQTAPAAQEHGAMGGPAMAAMTPEGRLKMLTEKLNLA
jgi:hypothetical protein